MSTDLQERVLALVTGAPGASSFDVLAREVFAFQHAHNAPYRAYCDRQSVRPDGATDWRNIPAVPAAAFKDLELTCFPPGRTVAEFHTSGTTTGRPGRHLLPTLALYDAALLAWFEPWLLPDRLRLPMLALTPAPDEAPHSSLVHMLDVVSKRHGTPDSSFYVRGGELEAERLTRDLHDHQWASQPVCLLGTAFAFVTLLDHWAATGVRFELPASSRVMETGGFKGRSRELTRPALYAALADRLGIAPDRIVNEYGMTELSSQFYDPSIVRGAASERKQAPPWTRVLIIDPRTGREAAAGERGLIRVLDLANVWSIMCVQTEDLGVADADGFTVLGRAAGAAVRGCSLTAEDLPLRSSP